MDQRPSSGLDGAPPGGAQLASGHEAPGSSDRPAKAGRLGFGLALILGAQYLVSLDGSIVAVALPHIQQELGFSSAGVQLVVTAYNVAFGGALVLAGRFGDLIGRRRLFIIGMIAFAVTSLLCALSQNPTMLVVGRVLQGLSAATIAPTALSLLTASVPEGPARASAMSKFGIATALGFVSGLVFSGLLVDAFHWRGVFFVTVPIGVAVAALAPRFIPRVAVVKHRIDWLGGLLITASVALLVVAPTQGASTGWTSPQFFVPLAVGLALMAAFLVVETRHSEPLMRLGLFRSKSLRTGNIVTVVAGFVSGTAYLLVTLYLQEVLGRTPWEAGLIVAPIGPLNILFGTVLGRLIMRLGVRTSLTTATFMAGLFIALVASQMSTDQNVFVFGLILLPMGLAMMATMVTSTLAATSGVAGHEQGLAAGVRQTCFQLGIALGVAVLVSVAASRTATLGSRIPQVAPADALVDGFQLALYILAGLVILASVVAFTGLRKQPA
ncbi:MFS transporter [Amycolatopsis sp. NPDC051071]|uniref:MFS transporter n=1 Tax=Amycolatopsis sp. NPDC051071 TaxID=3154637 RepID=UPI0034383757